MSIMQKSLNCPWVNRVISISAFIKFTRNVLSNPSSTSFCKSYYPSYDHVLTAFKEFEVFSFWRFHLTTGVVDKYFFKINLSTQHIIRIIPHSTILYVKIHKYFCHSPVHVPVAIFLKYDGSMSFGSNCIKNSCMKFS